MRAPSARRALFLVLALSLLAGCATPLRKLKPVDLPRLPESKGFYGGKMHPTAPWLYEGSTAKYHHFRYTYTRDNLIFPMRVLVAKTDMRLPFEQPKDAVPYPGIEVVLVWDDALFGYSFAKSIAPDPANSRWQEFNAPPRPFNQTLDLLPRE